MVRPAVHIKGTLPRFSTRYAIQAGTKKASMESTAANNRNAGSTVVRWKVEAVRGCLRNRRERQQQQVQLKDFFEKDEVDVARQQNAWEKKQDEADGIPWGRDSGILEGRGWSRWLGS